MPAVANRSVSAISRLNLQPGAVRVAIIATAPPPIITGGPALSLGGDHGARRGTDSSARNGAAAAPNRTAQDTTERAADDRPAEHVLRRGLLNRQHAREPQE